MLCVTQESIVLQQGRANERERDAHIPGNSYTYGIDTGSSEYLSDGRCVRDADGQFNIVWNAKEKPQLHDRRHPLIY